VNNRKSFSFSSEAFAGKRITYRHQKEAQPEGQHDDIQHGVLLVALVSGRDAYAFRERRLRWIKNNKRLVAPNCRVPRCTYVSRWVLRQRYRKVISVGGFDVSHCERVYLDRAAWVTRNARFFSDLGGDIAQRQGDVRKVPTAEVASLIRSPRPQAPILLVEFRG
jgi:hypothetical protein